MTAGDVLRMAGVVFAAAVLQAVIFSTLLVEGGSPNLLLVVVVCLGLLRGSVPGAFLGFAGGLVIDLLTLDTLGVTSLVLTLAGFWAGRYGETTARGRRLAPLVGVGVITVLAAVFSLVLHYMLGDEVDARQALLSSLAPELMLNLMLALPVYALLRSIVRERSALEPAGEVELVV
ncbi:MAG: rod shape-determining protein MreD [Gaiellaceae bacterium]